MSKDLGTQRRTHYSTALDSTMSGQTVTVMGWVLAVRGHGAISFMILRDKCGDLQIVVKSGVCDDTLCKKIGALKPHSVVGITGKIQEANRAPQGIEIVPSTIEIYSEVNLIAPFEPIAKIVKNIDTRLELRAIDLRRNIMQDIFNARNIILCAIRKYFTDTKFLEVHTPKLISTATEGGAALFSIFYYNETAFLAQSPQLYKEQLTMSFEKVFEIGPIFRAEPSRTLRHLSEAISVDFEEAFVDYNDVMSRISEIVTAASKAVDHHDGFKEKINVPQIPQTIPRYSYTEIIEKLDSAGVSTKWGSDLYPSALRKIGMEGFYFVYDWPLGPKPFYVKSKESDGKKISESFDLMYADLEISSGSTRISQRFELESRMKEKGLDTTKFDYHLRVFDYGMPPHAGCGIGLERLIMALTNTTDIKDTTFYPRDIDRLTP